MHRKLVMKPVFLRMYYIYIYIICVYMYIYIYLYLYFIIQFAIKSFHTYFH